MHIVTTKAREEMAQFTIVEQLHLKVLLVSAVMVKHRLEKLLLFVRFVTWLKPRIEWPLFAHKELNREKYHRKSC